MTATDKPTPDPGRWLERPGRNGKTVKWWMPTLRGTGRKWFKQDGSTALARAEAKRTAQEAEDNRRLSSRQLAAKLDKTANQEE